MNNANTKTDLHKRDTNRTSSEKYDRETKSTVINAIFQGFFISSVWSSDNIAKFDKR